MRSSRIKEIIGDEFDIREKEGAPWIVEVGLRLSAVTELNAGLVEESDVDMLIHERDRILIMFKCKLTELLWKYLGEIPNR